MWVLKYELLKYKWVNIRIKYVLLFVHPQKKSQSFPILIKRSTSWFWNGIVLSNIYLYEIHAKTPHKNKMDMKIARDTWHEREKVREICIKSHHPDKVKKSQKMMRNENIQKVLKHKQRKSWIQYAECNVW